MKVDSTNHIYNIWKNAKKIDWIICRRIKRDPSNIAILTHFKVVPKSQWTMIWVEYYLIDIKMLNIHKTKKC